MKRFFLFLAPVIIALLVFFVSLFFLSNKNDGTGALQVTASPKALVYVDGRLIGKTPLCKCEGKDMLKTGTYALKMVPLAGDNLASYEDSVTITKNILTVVDRTFGAGELSTGSIITLIPLHSPTDTQLFVSSFPVQAQVSLDGNVVGQTPLLLKSVTASDHDIVLSKDGYEEKTVHVHAVSGYELKALITLRIAQPQSTSSAVLQIATPTPIVQTKIIILDTPTGFLRVHADPSLSASETAQVKPGDSYPYLNEQDGWYEIQLADGSNGWISTQYAKKQ